MNDILDTGTKLGSGYLRRPLLRSSNVTSLISSIVEKSALRLRLRLRLLLRLMMLLWLVVLLLLLLLLMRLVHPYTTAIHQRTQVRLVSLIIQQSRTRSTQSGLSGIRRQIVRVVMVAVVSIRLVVGERLLRRRLSVSGLAKQRWAWCCSLARPSVVRLVLLVGGLVRIVMLRVRLVLRVLWLLRLSMLRVLKMLAVRGVLPRGLQGVRRRGRSDRARVVVVTARIIGKRCTAPAVRCFQSGRRKRALLRLQRRTRGVFAPSRPKHRITLVRWLTEPRRCIVQIRLISLAPLHPLDPLVPSWTVRTCSNRSFACSRDAHVTASQAAIRICQC